MHNHSNEILELLMLAIAGGYLIIAFQFFITLLSVRKKVQFKSALSLSLLVLVFVFCGLSGYVGKALHWSDDIEIGLHIFLLTCTIGFIATNQISVILHGLSNGDD